jgi:hypothetical protein
VGAEGVEQGNPRHPNTIRTEPVDTKGLSRRKTGNDQTKTSHNDKNIFTNRKGRDRRGRGTKTRNETPQRRRDPDPRKRTEEYTTVLCYKGFGEQKVRKKC